MNVFERIQRILVELLVVDESEITMESTWEDLGADSLDKLEFADMLGEEFNLLVSDEDAAQMSTVEDVVKHIQKHTKHNQ
ncbi:MAG: acyl carrier protein [Firmicutes bacterium]|nr:acyl carrier protein [Bacillota bacterium]